MDVFDKILIGLKGEKMEIEGICARITTKSRSELHIVC